MEQDTITDSIAVQDASGLGALVRLPQELRDRIYDIVFDSGHTALLRVSRSVHENAKGILNRDRILQANIVHYEFKTWLDQNCRYSQEPPLPGIDFDLIRSLYITITISAETTDIRCRQNGGCIMTLLYANSNLFHIFRGMVLPIKKRARCDLRLELPAFRETQRVELAALWWLRGFQRLNVKVSHFLSLSSFHNIPSAMNLTLVDVLQQQ